MKMAHRTRPGRQGRRAHARRRPHGNGLRGQRDPQHLRRLRRHGRDRRFRPRPLRPRVRGHGTPPGRLVGDRRRRHPRRPPGRGGGGRADVGAHRPGREGGDTSALEGGDPELDAADRRPHEWAYRSCGFTSVAQTGQLRQPDPGVDEQANDRRMATLLVARPSQTASSRRGSSSLGTGTGASGTAGGLIRAVGGAGIPPRPRASGRTAARSGTERRGSRASIQRAGPDEGLDVLPADVLSGGRRPALSEEHG